MAFIVPPNSTIKITYLVPEPSSKGGMTVISQMLYEEGLFENNQIKHFNTSFTWGQSKFTKFFEFFVLRFKFIVHLITFKPDVIFVMSSSYMGFYEKCLYCLIARVFGVKTLLNHVGGGFKDFYESNSINKFFVKQFIKFPHAVLIASSYWNNYFKKNFDFIKLYNVPNPVMAVPFSTGNITKDTNTIKVVSVFRITKDKGVIELAEVIKIVCAATSHINFVIMGGGDMEEWIKTELDYLIVNGRVEILGFVDDATKIKEVTTAHIFMMLTYFDVFPISIMEAMAASNTIISTTVGGIPDLVTDGINGFLFEPGEINKVADKLIEISNKQEMLKQMGSLNKQIVLENYDISAALKRHFQIANEMVKQ